MSRQPAMSTVFPYTTLFRSDERLRREHEVSLAHALDRLPGVRTLSTGEQVGKPIIRGLTGPRVLVLDNGERLEDYSWSEDRKSTRLNSSHVEISYAVFCLKK